MANLQEIWNSQNGEYNPEICKLICKEAGLDTEWEQANGDNFEQVLEKACNILGIEY